MSDDIEALKNQLSILKAELDTVKTEKQSLQDQVSSMEAEKHSEEIRLTAEARFKAGLCKELAKEIENIKDYDNSVLRLLRADAEKIVKVQETRPLPTKWKNTPDESSEMEASVLKMKARMGLSSKILTGGIK